MAYEIQGRTNGNEDKTRLIKDGYDIYCPQCEFHYSHADFTIRQECPKCGFIWRVGHNGSPNTNMVVD